MNLFKKAQKATLSSEEAGIELACQFNPHELKISRKVAWDSGKQFLARYPSLQFQSAGHDTLTFDLFFDESGEKASEGMADDIALAAAALNPMFSVAGVTIGPTNDNTVQEKLDMLYALTTPTKWKKVEDARPPFVSFEWAKFKFIGAITGCEVAIKLFDEDGAPRRATVGITMLGRLDWDPANAITAPKKGEGMNPVDFK